MRGMDLSDEKSDYTIGVTLEVSKHDDAFG